MDNNGIAEALNIALKLKDDSYSKDLLTIDGRQYSHRSINPVFEPHAKILAIETLTGLADYVGSKDHGMAPANLLILVDSPMVAELYGPVFGPFKQRPMLAKADCSESTQRFGFGKFMTSEAFIIGVSAMFTEAGDRDQLLKDVAAIKTEGGAVVSDDGTSQTVNVVAGARLVTERQTKPRVQLAPFCTFLEVEQPLREFVFRLNSEGQPALFEADGGKWRAEAMQSVKTWLKDALPEVTVIA